MAATITLKRKCYSDDEKKGMSTAAKVGLGVLGTGLALAAANKGMLGQNAKNVTNKMLTPVKERAAGLMNKQVSKGKNLTDQKLIANGRLNSNSQRAANSGVKLDTSTSAAKEQLAQGTGINSVPKGKVLNELEFERFGAFSAKD